MKSLKGTKTEKNLEEAFAGESMARNKYTYFASKARKDGYQQIAAIFGGSGVIPWQSYPKMIDKRYMKNGRSDTPCS